MEKIISCDWGTSSLRLRLADADGSSVLAEVTGSQGIFTTFESWKKAGQDRLSFYRAVLKNQIAALEKEAGSSLAGIPLIISGMASANIGMMELPYKELPFSTGGSDLVTGIMKATDDFHHLIIVVSGGKMDADVIRGEETQLIGSVPPGPESLPENEAGEHLYLFPGTHSKHLLVRAGCAVRFSTYMTGEFFSLLSKQSILSGSVEENALPAEGGRLKSFEEGVAEGASANLLHSAFLVRTNSLFGTKTKEENYHYLSGLCIGAELRELVAPGKPAGIGEPIAGFQPPLTVVGSGSQKGPYLAALRKLGIPVTGFQDAAQAVIRGHYKIYHQYISDIKPS
jgi:2-dehydro-3-deoxygalactonokinase